MNNKFAENTKKRLNKVIGYGIWFLILLLGLTLARNVAMAARIKAAISSEKNKVAKMQSDNQNLEEQILTTQTGVFMEREVRDKLGLAKPGEAIVVLPDDEALRKLAPPAPNQAETLPDPNWKKWLKLFMV